MRGVMKPSQKDKELFERIAKSYIDQRDDYELHATPLKPAAVLKNLDLEKIKDELQKAIPKMLTEVIECLKDRVVLQNGAKKPLISFLEKIDPQAITVSFKQNEPLLQPDEKLYKFFNINDLEFNSALSQGIELINEMHLNDASNLFHILTLLDSKSLDAWMGLGMTLFLSGAKAQDNLEYFEEALDSFWKAHLLDPCNIAPAIGMVESFISLQRYQEAKKILNKFSDMTLDEKTTESLNILNAEIEDKI